MSFGLMAVGASCSIVGLLTFASPAPFLRSQGVRRLGENLQARHRRRVPHRVRILPRHHRGRGVSRDR